MSGEHGSRGGLFAAAMLAALLAGCGGPPEPELWIYTSIYRDVLETLEPEAQAAMPGVRLRWYKAGSEEVAARLTAELAAGGSPADVLVTADPFWYEALADEGQLRPLPAALARPVPERLRHPKGMYLTSRAAVMILAYNAKILGAGEAPQTFAELAQPRWRGKVAIGDPLKSGTAFVTVAALVKRLGWDYYRALRANETVVEGGNSAVLRRIETGDRPVGVILLENILKARETGSPATIVYPEDGAIVIPSPVAIVASTDRPADAERFVAFMLGRAGQKAMARGYMYPVDPSVDGPRGAPPFAQLLTRAFCPDASFIRDVTARREELKETFGQVMFE